MTPYLDTVNLLKSILLLKWFTQCRVTNIPLNGIILLETANKYA